MSAKAAKRKTSVRAAGNGGAAGKNSRRPADLAAIRQKITNLVANKAYDMVKDTVEDIEKKGNLTAMKFLFEVIGLYPAVAGEEEPVGGEGSLTKTLFEKLGLPEEKEEGAERTEQYGTEIVRIPADAVE
jgi:hypothetical protein